MKSFTIIFFVSTLFISALLCPSLNAQEAQPRPATREEILPDLVRRADSSYKAINTPDKKYGVREIFTAMLAYAESNTNLTRIAEFMGKAEAMQQRNPELPWYGNFYWYSTECEVNDINAVDFCMQHAQLLWRFHHDKLDPDTQKRLRKIIILGVHALKKHQPRATYTNIALLNASDLILLGELLHDQVAIDEGNRRLNIFIKTVWEQGINEYVSATYYGVDLEAMALLKELSEVESTRLTAGIILDLLWHDIALNWNINTEILSGTNSRTYDFLYNRGELDQMLTATGWLERPEGKNRRHFQYRTFTPLYTRWHPPSSLYQLSISQFPRTVKQIFGNQMRTARTHCLHKEITLSTSGTLYGGRMDVPLTVDLPQTRTALKPRLYFIPDGRNDPYGKKTIAEGKSHSKALHLNPWWAAAQHKEDALALVLYTDNVFGEVTEALQSHLVFRKEIGGIFIDDQKLDISGLKNTPCILTTDQCVFLREGNTVTGIQIPWAQSQGGAPASISIIDDGNPDGALRLSIVHQCNVREKDSGLETAGAAFRLRIASSIKTEQQWADFRKSFAADRVQIDKETGGLKITAVSKGVPLIVAADSLIKPVAAIIAPSPTSAVLALDGADIGRAILEKSAVVREYIKDKTTLIKINIEAGKTTTWSALKGTFTVPIEKVDEGDRSYLWSPEMDGARLGHNGRMTWLIAIAQSGKYAIEAEILAPTPEDDSFFVSATLPNGTLVIPVFTWSTGISDDWRWARVTDRTDKKSQQLFDLPAGDLRVIFDTREAGIKLSQLRLLWISD